MFSIPPTALTSPRAQQNIRGIVQVHCALLLLSFLKLSRNSFVCYKMHDLCFCGMSIHCSCVKNDCA